MWLFFGAAESVGLKCSFLDACKINVTKCPAKAKRKPPIFNIRVGACVGLRF